MDISGNYLVVVEQIGVHLNTDVVDIGDVIYVDLRSWLFFLIVGALLLNKRLRVHSVPLLRLWTSVLNRGFGLRQCHWLHRLVLLLDQLHDWVVVDLSYKSFLRSNHDVFNYYLRVFVRKTLFFLPVVLNVRTINK